VIFVTHDIGVAVEVSDRIGVMYAGKLVELGGVEQMVDAPRHPYTRGLLASTVHGGMRGQRLEAIPGAPPDLAEMPAALQLRATLQARRGQVPLRPAAAARSRRQSSGALRGDGLKRGPVCNRRARAGQCEDC
jgi:oligopeptide/dipeptide ABC transporter ATP-binding protein